MPERLVDRFARLPDNVRGAAWLIAGGLCFTGVGVLIKAMGQSFDFLQLAFFRCFFGLLFVLPEMMRQRWRPLQSKKRMAHFWRAALGTSGMVTSFYALAHLPLADATAISFTTPLFIVIVAALFLGETVRWRRWTATAVGFCGVLVMMRPGEGSFDVVALVALLSACLSAFAVSVVKSLTRTEGTTTMLIMFTLWSTVFTLVPAILVWRPPSAMEWGMAVGMGLLATLGQSALIRAYTAGEASAIAPFDYLRLPFAGLAGWFVFAELPTVWTLLGALIIVASTLYIAHREAQLGKRVDPEVKSQKFPS